MIRQTKKNGFFLGGGLELLALFCMLTLAASLAAQGNQAQPWTAPASDRDVKNPVPATAESVTAGKTIYEDNCMMCHGEKGAGDGIAGQSLPVKPADLTDVKLMKSETDGSLYWKITTGRGFMPNWKESLSDTQRWQLVHYIRTLSKSGTGEKLAVQGREER